MDALNVRELHHLLPRLLFLISLDCSIFGFSERHRWYSLAEARPALKTAQAQECQAVSTGAGDKRPGMRSFDAARDMYWMQLGGTGGSVRVRAKAMLICVWTCGCVRACVCVRECECV